MKVSYPKLFMSFIICVLIGILCYYISPEVDGRKWISLFVSTISLFICFAPALSFDYDKPGRRSVSSKIMSWLFFGLLLIMNICFCAHEYVPLIYIVTIFLTTLVGVIIQYSISKI